MAKRGRPKKHNNLDIFQKFNLKHSSYKAKTVSERTLINKKFFCIAFKALENDNDAKDFFSFDSEKPIRESVLVELGRLGHPDLIVKQFRVFFNAINNLDKIPTTHKMVESLRRQRLKLFKKPENKENNSNELT